MNSCGNAKIKAMKIYPEGKTGLLQNLHPSKFPTIWFCRQIVYLDASSCLFFLCLFADMMISSGYSLGLMTSVTCLFSSPTFCPIATATAWLNRHEVTPLFVYWGWWKVYFRYQSVWVVLHAPQFWSFHSPSLSECVQERKCSMPFQLHGELDVRM